MSCMKCDCGQIMYKCMRCKEFFCASCERIKSASYSKQKFNSCPGCGSDHVVTASGINDGTYGEDK